MCIELYIFIFYYFCARLDLVKDYCLYLSFFAKLLFFVIYLKIVMSKCIEKYLYIVDL